MPRARLEDLQGYLTTSSVADALGLTRYLVKARIADGTLPKASKVTESGVLLFDDAWLEEARRMAGTARARRRRGAVRSASRIPSPRQVLDHVPGEAGWIPGWDQIVEYFRQLDAASDRVSVEVLGESTDGKPYIVVAVSAPENLHPGARQGNSELLGRLWDARGVSAADAGRIADEARTVGIVLASQHSNEIGAALMTMELAHDLAASNDPGTTEILANTVTLLVPSHNPDGVQMIAEWYRRWLGTEFEGCEIPWLYHPYVGHDNNRDWFMLTQAETKLYVDFHNREHPQAVFDMHQMGRFGPRFMVPPFIDPLDPNQDPVIQQGFAALGAHIAQRLTANGKAGVVTNAIFDNYSPSLAYGNYHGSVDLLSEAASVKLATPVTLTEDDLNNEYGIDPRERTWNQPQPWKGGEWTLREIVEYNKIAARGFIEHLARNRAQWLRDYATVARSIGTRTEKPYAFVFPADQIDHGATTELLQTLQHGLVEVEEATAEIELDGIGYPTGTRIVRLDQPAGAFAKTLLEVQEYPDLRRWPDGPPKRPYDIAGHTLPIQMGVWAVPVDRPLGDDRPLRSLDPLPRWTSDIARLPEGEAVANAWAIDARANASVRALNVLLNDDVPVARVRERVREAGLHPGDYLVMTSDRGNDEMIALAQATGATIREVRVDEDAPRWRHSPVRLGLYQPWTACIDEGWARWVLEEYGTPYTTLRNDDIRQGNLRDRFDALVIPEMTPHAALHGRGEKTKEKDPYPVEYQGGLGETGMEALRRFVDAGGTLIAIDRATRAIIDGLALPVRNPLRALKDDAFYCPGSLLRVVMDTGHPLGLGLPRDTAVLFMNSMVFEAMGRDTTLVGTYPIGDPNLSGWILGSEHLEGKGALAEVRYGDGRVILIGFRPYFRAQTRGTYRVFFNAIARAGLADDEVDAVAASVE